tara:strand:+ start:218 stop:499 length:282 start_codon:yes stop_codon:yes gene_type:complete
MSKVKENKWLEGTKPKYIESRYNSYLTWDLEELGIDWDEVENWDINRLTLCIKFKDGTTKDYETWNFGEVDYKHGLEEVLILDENWSQVEGLN